LFFLRCPAPQVASSSRSLLLAMLGGEAVEAALHLI